MALNDFRAIYLPYFLKRQDDGKYIVLNRKYKPLGFNPNEYLTYSDYPISSLLKGMTDSKVVELSWNDSINKEEIFLYDDASIPTRSKDDMNAYLIRLQLLAELKIG